MLPTTLAHGIFSMNNNWKGARSVGEQWGQARQLGELVATAFVKLTLRVSES
jgi:hypothetical protein